LAENKKIGLICLAKAKSASCPDLDPNPSRNAVGQAAVPIYRKKRSIDDI